LKRDENETETEYIGRIQWCLQHNSLKYKIIKLFFWMGLLPQQVNFEPKQNWDNNEFVVFVSFSDDLRIKYCRDEKNEYSSESYQSFLIKSFEEDGIPLITANDPTNPCERDKMKPNYKKRNWKHETRK